MYFIFLNKKYSITEFNTTGIPMYSTFRKRFVQSVNHFSHVRNNNINLNTVETGLMTVFIFAIFFFIDL